MSTETDTEIGVMAVFPSRYELHISDNNWGWCKLKDVARVAQKLADKRGFKWRIFSRNEFILRFCLLSNLRAVSKGKFFYSNSGQVMSCTHEELPEHAPGEIRDDTFVPEGWVKDVLMVVSKGGNRVLGGTLGHPGRPTDSNFLLCTGDKEPFFIEESV